MLTMFLMREELSEKKSLCVKGKLCFELDTRESMLNYEAQEIGNKKEREKNGTKLG